MRPETMLRSLFTVLLVTACAHRPAVVRFSGLPEARESFAQVETYTDGSPRRVVIEDVLPPDRTCEPVVRRHFHYDTAGQLYRQVIEIERCGIVETRIEERIQLGDVVTIRTTYLDHDHDGELDLVRREQPGEVIHSLRGQLARLPSARN